jgi:hypothetical protein
MELQEIHEPKLTLRHLRLLSLSNHRHDHVWYENQSIPAHKFSLGDFGYIPGGKNGNGEVNGFNGFVSLGNVFKDGLLDRDVVGVVENAAGDCWNWKTVPIRREAIQGHSMEHSIYW